MKICRYQNRSGETRIGMATQDPGFIYELKSAGIQDLQVILESNDPAGELQRIAAACSALPRVSPKEIRLLAPVESQEVWAAGVTYLRSKTARMDESVFSATAYDRVYAANRPELFFKSMPGKVVHPGEPVGIRSDARWNVPEPELALVLNSRGNVVGFTIGNDMSSRDIEGENLLYLPQAKIYTGSCALGPWIVLGQTEVEVREWGISLAVLRGGEAVFQGETRVSQIKRTFAELADYLFRCQRFPAGAVLLTGTGIVPPDSFTLRAGDEVVIRIGGVGELRNRVVAV